MCKTQDQRSLIEVSHSPLKQWTVHSLWPFQYTLNQIMTDDISFLRLENHGPYDTWPKKTKLQESLRLYEQIKRGKNKKNIFLVWVEWPFICKNFNFLYSGCYSYVVKFIEIGTIVLNFFLFTSRQAFYPMSKLSPREKGVAPRLNTTFTQDCFVLKIG